ncbi:MAG: toll/interleukin-1 receptor domain-containing protein [Patescibacteria group bacterium]
MIERRKFNLNNKDGGSVYNKAEQSEVSMEPLNVSERRASLQNLKAGVESLQKTLDTEASQKGTEKTITYKKRKDSLEEVEAIAEGIADMHPLLAKLPSREVMVSYSRRNEEMARKLHLALRSIGMLVWFDNQETNITIDEEEFSSSGGAELAKGLPLGNRWKESINAGIPEKGQTVVLLTHDVLDKFDVVGGQEIAKAIEKKSNVIVVLLDDENRGSILERLESFAKEKEGNDKYESAVETLKKAKHITLNNGDFAKSHRELGEQIIESMTGEETPESTTMEDPIQKKPARSNQEKNSQTDAEILESELGNLQRAIANTTPQEADLYKRALEESKIIVAGMAAPETLVDNNLLRQKSFYYQPFKDGDTLYGALAEAFVELGLYKNEDINSDSYALLPITEEMINADNETFEDYFINYMESHRKFWMLSNPDFFSQLSETLKELEKKMKEENSPDSNKSLIYSAKKRFLEELKKTQGIQIQNEDLKDPHALASYMLTKQALVEYAIRYKVQKNEESQFLPTKEEDVFLS